MVDKNEKYRKTNLTNDRKNTNKRTYMTHSSMYKFTLIYPWIVLIVAVKAFLADEDETGLGISELAEFHWFWKIS